MRFAAVVLALLSATLVNSKSFFGTSQKSLEDEPEFPVPGVNPLGFCHDPASYILTVDQVDLSPNPPVPGEKLYINATGTFSEKVEKGAKVNLVVKLNKYITLIKTEQDLCDNLGKIDVECPLEDRLVITRDVDIPKQVPKGNYEVFALVKTKDEKEVTCMQGTVHF